MDLAIVLAFLALYGWVTASGLIFTHNDRRIGPMLVAVALQIPWFSCPLFSYRFTSGFHLTAGVIGGRFNAGFNLGSDWQCSVLQGSPWGFGVNLFAILMLALLWTRPRVSGN
jgi:hypothetical protein